MNATKELIGVISKLNVSIQLDHSYVFVIEGTQEMVRTVKVCRILSS